MLEGSEICRILPSSDSGSAVKNRDRPTRPLFIATATCGFVEHLPGAARAIAFCDGPGAQNLSGILAHILLAMLRLLGLGRMGSRNAPVGGADGNIAVPNGNILDASGRCLSRNIAGVEDGDYSLLTRKRSPTRFSTC